MQKTQKFRITAFSLVASLLSLTASVTPARAADAVDNSVNAPQPNASILIVGEKLIGQQSSSICMQEVLQALKAKPNDAKLLLLKAAIENYECQYAKSIADSTAVLRANPNNERALVLRSEARLRSALFDLARQDMLDAGRLSSPENYKDNFSEIDTLEYDFQHQVKEKERKLALATTAVLFSQNEEGCESLAGAQLTNSVKNSQKRLLVRWWNVNNRTELLDLLKYQLTTGHNRRWQNMQKEYEANRPLDRFRSGWTDAHDYEVGVSLLKKYGKQFGTRGLLAWDHCRYIALCRWGYQCGYLTEAEAWELIMPVAARIQKQSKNWDQLATDYLIGRHFWSDTIYQEGNDTVQKIKYRLLHDPGSTWVKIPLHSVKIAVPSDDAAIIASIDRMLSAGSKVQRSTQ